MDRHHPARLRIQELKRSVLTELATRRCGNEGISYADKRHGRESLYGITGAINILAALGVSLGSREQRTATAARMLAYRGADGLFGEGDGPGHAAHMVIAALNLLGEPIPEDIAPLAPTDPAMLESWLGQLDWSSTHKEFCGQTIPLLASGRVDGNWIDVLMRHTTSRLHPERPLEVWCPADAPPWRVISCMYHVLSAFDAGRIRYPCPDLLLRRLLELRWDEVADGEPRTFCTDGDWAVLRLRLCIEFPESFPDAMRAIRRVSARRVLEWLDRRDGILAAGTHHLYCYLWSTAVFQSHASEHYSGGIVRDTFNDPALMCLEDRSALADEV